MRFEKRLPAPHDGTRSDGRDAGGRAAWSREAPGGGGGREGGRGQAAGDAPSLIGRGARDGQTHGIATCT